MTDTPAVQLHIERIVIDGVPMTQVQAGQLRGALEVELARLLTDGGHHDWHSSALRALAAPAVNITTPVRPFDLGRAIARSVHASLTRDA